MQSPVSTSTRPRPTPSGFWRWSPARTSNLATTKAHGGSSLATTPGRIVSTVDPESRHIHKSVSSYRDGYKAHVAIEPDTGLVTGASSPPVCDRRRRRTRAPRRRGARAGGLRRLRLRLQRDPGRDPPPGPRPVIKPIPLRAGIPGGFNRDDFVIDHHARTATCPAGHTVAITAAGTPSSAFDARTARCAALHHRQDGQDPPHPRPR